MSTDLHDRPRQPSPGEEPDRREAPKSSLSIVQIVGGALAAMTAAALGSRLSLAGTVIGAAFASVVAALASALYTASLRRTTRGVSTVIARVRPTTPGGSPAPPAAGGTTSVDDTRVAPAAGWVVAAAGADPAADAETSAAPSRAHIGWKRVLIGALLMFVAAALVLTGIELATGRALSGGSGTTVSQVAEPDTRPSVAPTGSPTPSATPSAAPSATGTPAPGSRPTARPTPVSSATPSATSVPTPSSTPTTTVVPSPASPTS